MKVIFSIFLDSCKGVIEQWLKMLEEEMLSTMQKVIEESLEDFFKNEKRIQWIQRKWPGQVVQTVDQIVWTSRVEDSIMRQNDLTLNKYYEHLDLDVNTNLNLAKRHC
jgi:hypothetical protein